MSPVVTLYDLCGVYQDTSSVIYDDCVSLMAQLNEVSTSRFLGDVFGSFDRADPSTECDYVHVGACKPSNLDTVQPTYSDPLFAMWWEGPGVCQDAVALYAQTLCSDAFDCTLNEYAAIAENMTISAYGQGLDATNAPLFSTPERTRFLTAQMNGSAIYQQLYCALRIYQSLHVFCSLNTDYATPPYVTGPDDWGFGLQGAGGSGETQVIFQSNEVGLNTVLFEDFDRDNDADDYVFFTSKACMAQLGQSVLECNVRIVPMARGSDYVNGLRLNYNATTRSNDNAPNPGCRSVTMGLPRPQFQSLEDLFNASSVCPIDLIGNVDVLYLKKDPSDHVPGMGYLCNSVTTIGGAFTNPLAECSTINTGEDLVLVQDTTNTLRTNPQTKYSNTYNRTSWRSPDATLLVRVEFAEPPYHPVPSEMQSYVDRVSDVYMFNSDCNIDVQVFQANEAFLNPYGMPYAMYVPSPAIVYWSNEGVPLYAGESTCLGGSRAGLYCNSTLNPCPGGGTCRLSTFSCQGGTNTGGFCNSLGQCPAGTDCYIGGGLYPTLVGHFECATLGCYTDPFPDPACYVLACYDPTIEFWYDFPAERQPNSDAYPFPFGFFVDNAFYP